MNLRAPLTRRGFLAGAGVAGVSLAAGGWPARSLPLLVPGAPERGLAPGSIRPFDIEGVRLLPGPLADMRALNSRYLLSLPPDRLLHTFRVNAGLPSSAQPLGGWEKPDCELRGHFTGGHYLSACALTHACTGAEEFKERAALMVRELALCQRAHGNGYLSAFPEELFDRLRNGAKVWAPFYTLHKILAGHLHVAAHCGNAQALESAEALGGWVRNWTKGLSDAHMQRILGTEFGGMGEALLDLYAVTGKEEYLEVAARFDHRALLDPLAARRDELTGLHANTQIPKIVAAARRYELTGDRRDRDVAEYFWREVTRERTYCTGGTSDGERWLTPAGVLSTAISSSSAECCCAYNMLRLTRHVFAWTGDPRVADYAERTFWNARVGTQNPEDGTLMYYFPLAPGYWKFFGAPLDAFWCCTGTGVEEFARLGDGVYFRDGAGIFVNGFVASEASWPERGVRVRQETRFPEEPRTTLRIEMERPAEWTLRVRVPWWTRARNGRVRLNGAALPVFAEPSSFLTLSRLWKTGDSVELELPMEPAIETMPDDPSMQAALYGPLVLAGRLGPRGLTRAMTYGGYDAELKGDPVPVPEIVRDAADPVWIERVPGEPLAFRTRGAEQIALAPLNRIFGERYAVYWKVTSGSRPA